MACRVPGTSRSGGTRTGVKKICIISGVRRRGGTTRWTQPNGHPCPECGAPRQAGQHAVVRLRPARRRRPARHPHGGGGGGGGLRSAADTAVRRPARHQPDATTPDGSPRATKGTPSAPGRLGRRHRGARRRTRTRTLARTPPGGPPEAAHPSTHGGPTDSGARPAYGMRPAEGPAAHKGTPSTSATLGDGSRRRADGRGRGPVTRRSRAPVHARRTTTSNATPAHRTQPTEGPAAHKGTPAPRIGGRRRLRLGARGRGTRRHDDLGRPSARTPRRRARWHRLGGSRGRRGGIPRAGRPHPHPWRHRKPRPRVRRTASPGGSRCRRHRGGTPRAGRPHPHPGGTGNRASAPGEQDPADAVGSTAADGSHHQAAGRGRNRRAATPPCPAPSAPTARLPADPHPDTGRPSSPPPPPAPHSPTPTISASSTTPRALRAVSAGAPAPRPGTDAHRDRGNRRRRGALIAASGAVVAVLGRGGWASGLFSYETPSRDTAAPDDVRASVPDASSRAPSAEPSSGAPVHLRRRVRSRRSHRPRARASGRRHPRRRLPRRHRARPRPPSRRDPVARRASAPAVAPEPSEPADTAPVLRRGDRGPEVVELQQRLRQV